MPNATRLALGGALGVVGAAAAAGSVAALNAAHRRWADAHDPTHGTPLTVPEGEERHVRSFDGANLWVTDAGPRDAEAMFVLAHGWTNDRRIWGAVAGRLVERGHRVIAWDHRGHGRSGTGHHGFSLDALAGDVRSVLEHFDVHGVVLAGHSMGGMATQAFAARHPDAFAERVKAVALVSTACNRLRSGAPRADTVGPWLIAHPRLERAMGSARLGPALMRNTVGRVAALSHLEAMRETFVGTSPEARAGFLTAMLGMDFASALSDVDVPAAVLVGTHDRLTPPAHAERLAELLPHARLEVLPGAGHMLPFERPDRVAAVLEELATGSQGSDGQSVVGTGSVSVVGTGSVSGAASGSGRRVNTRVR